MTAAQTGGGGEQPAPMGWGAHGRDGPRGLASMDLGGIAWWRQGLIIRPVSGNRRPQLQFTGPV